MSQTSNRPEDWEALICQHETKLYRAAFAILGNRQDAEDAVQDAFLKYLERAPVFSCPEQESAWLMKVTVNRSISITRSIWRRREPLPPDLPACTSAVQKIEELYALPVQDRATLHLYYYEGYSTKEIASFLKMRPGAVRSKLCRARGKLKQLLEGESP